MALDKKSYLKMGENLPLMIFLRITEALKINVSSTAAESPWYNRVVERHNQALATMIDKITEDIKPFLHSQWNQHEV